MIVRTRLAIIIGALAVLFAALAVVGFVATRDGSKPPVAAEPDGSKPIPARPAPEQPPTPVEADGTCGAAMETIRVIQHEFPSGSMLTEAANAELTADLARLDDACTTDLAQEFRRREVTPWLTYLPPGVG